MHSQQKVCVRDQGCKCKKKSLLIDVKLIWNILQIQVDLDLDTSKGYDESNVLALPSKKRDTKQKHEQQKKVRRLTKKERKKLERVVEQKDKKAKVMVNIIIIFQSLCLFFLYSRKS